MRYSTPGHVFRRNRFRCCCVAVLIAALIAALFAPGLGAEENTEEEKTLYQLLRESGRFNMFLNVVAETDLVEMLEGDEPLTLFAPGDDAFDLLDTELIDLLMHPSQKHYRQRLVGNHMIEDTILSGDRRGEGEQEVETLAGTRLTYVSESDRFFLETSAVVERDIEASNGVLHRIDRILVPRF